MNMTISHALEGDMEDTAKRQDYQLRVEEKQQTKHTEDWKLFISESDLDELSRVSTGWMYIAANLHIARAREQASEEKTEDDITIMIRNIASGGALTELELIDRYIEEMAEDLEEEEELTDGQLYEYQCEVQNVITKMIKEGKLKIRAEAVRREERVLELEDG